MSLEAQIQNLESLDINPDEIENKKYSEAFRLLFSIIELRNEKIENLNSENQKLRDENNLLKGEQIKPKINGSKRNDDVSSETERKKLNPPKKRESNSRKDQIAGGHPNLKDGVCKGRPPLSWNCLVFY